MAGAAEPERGPPFGSTPQPSAGCERRSPTLLGPRARGWGRACALSCSRRTRAWPAIRARTSGGGC
eukprot:15197950-Alexandrium_andersonii.AAC.1